MYVLGSVVAQQLQSPEIMSSNPILGTNCFCFFSDFITFMVACEAASEVNFDLEFEFSDLNYLYCYAFWPLNASIR